MVRPSYRLAIAWLAANDDNEWLANDQDNMSVSACLVADLFDKSDTDVRAALKRALRRLEGVS